MQNRGGVSSALAKSVYTQPALVPPMPWASKKAPPTPVASAQRGRRGTLVRWSLVAGASKYAVQARYGQRWVMAAVVHGRQSRVTLSGSPDAIAVVSADRFGTTSAPSVLGKR